MARDKAVTRQKLIDATREKLFTDGIESINVDNVCKLAGFTRGAFYSNFKKIDELILVTVKQELDNFVTRFVAMSDEWVKAIQKLTPGYDGMDTVEQLQTLMLNTKSAGQLDRNFFVVYSEIQTKSIRVPEWTEKIAPLMANFVESVGDILLAMLRSVGREAIVRKEFLAQAVIGVVMRSKGLGTWNPQVESYLGENGEYRDSVITDQEITLINARMLYSFSSARR